MKKVKWGVIGAGGIADRRTIPGMMLAENAELVAVMEINTELAEKIRAKYNANTPIPTHLSLSQTTKLRQFILLLPLPIIRIRSSPPQRQVNTFSAKSPSL